MCFIVYPLISLTVVGCVSYLMSPKGRNSKSLNSQPMYCITIAKLSGPDNNIWAGFNMNSQLLLEGDVIREVEYYNGTFKVIEKGELAVIETEWENFHVMIQYRRIN